MTPRWSRDPAPAPGIGVGLVLVVVLTALLVPVRTDITLATPALALMGAVTVAAVVGGRSAGLVTSVLATIAFNLAFIRPYWTFNIAIVDDLVAFAVFTGVGLAVGSLMAVQTQRRRLAEHRARQLQQLYDELRVVEADRERLAEEATRVAVLEQVDAQRAALLRSVSHDLRTPLAVIAAVVSDLRDGAEYAPDTRDDLLGLVIAEAQRLDQLVANLLSLSRIEAHALRPERQAVSLPELVDACARRLDRLLDRSRVKVEMPADLPWVDADYALLDQVVANLLENAARHAPPQSAIEIGAEVLDGSWIRVRVQDEGPGVPEEHRDRIFEPFWTGSGRVASGVGLAICRAVVEAHGGTIELESSGAGARFAFTIPVREG